MRIIDFFDRSADRAPESVFLIQGEISRSYRDSRQASERVAAALQRDGIEPGKRVAFWSPNDWRMVEALLGVFRAGAVMVPLNARNGLTENIDFLKDASAEVLFIHDRYSEHVPEIIAHCPLITRIITIGGGMAGAVPYDGWVERNQAAKPVAYQPEDLWAIYGTSGTTGRSKCVAHTHLSATAAMMDMMHCLAAHGPARHLVVAPISHVAGIFLFALTAAGSTHVILDGASPSDIIEAVAREEIEILFLPPTLVYMLLAEPDADRLRATPLRALVCAGAPIAPDKMRRAIETFGPVMMNVLGQTEAIAPITALQPSDYIGVADDVLEARLGSIGRPCLMRQVEIMDDDGHLLPPDEVGEIVVRGWGVTPGYVQPDGSIIRDEALFAFGWLHTGDVGRKDADGYITLIDRKKDMIISGGFNVYPFEVEQTLLAHPAVLDVAVVGVPDEKWGEAVKAVVELAPDAVGDAAELIAFCKARIGSLKSPKSIEFWEKLPRGATGKVMKRIVREHYWQGRERRV